MNQNGLAQGISRHPYLHRIEKRNRNYITGIPGETSIDVTFCSCPESVLRGVQPGCDHIWKFQWQKITEKRNKPFTMKFVNQITLKNNENRNRWWRTQWTCISASSGQLLLWYIITLTVNIHQIIALWNNIFVLFIVFVGKWMNAQSRHTLAVLSYEAVAI